MIKFVKLSFYSACCRRSLLLFDWFSYFIANREKSWNEFSEDTSNAQIVVSNVKHDRVDILFSLPPFIALLIGDLNAPTH